MIYIASGSVSPLFLFHYKSFIIMDIKLRKSQDRGYANNGWLETRYSFSFSDYYNPEYIRFGKLRVLNDDIIQQSKGFGLHPHEDMEIITIPIEGGLRHTDNMGNESIIGKNEVQVMSAGSGIWHSEFNASDELPVSLLQIWIFPKEKNLTPRYDQKVFNSSNNKAEWQLFVSPDGRDSSLWINQDAYISMISPNENREVTYNLYNSSNSIYMFLIQGNITIGKNKLGDRDALGIFEPLQSFTIDIKAGSKLLAIEVPR